MEPSSQNAASGGGIAFSAEHYLQQTAGALTRPELAAAHYAAHGWRNGLCPHPGFDPVAYRIWRGGGLAPEAEPLAHHLQHR